MKLTQMLAMSLLFLLSVNPLEAQQCHSTPAWQSMQKSEIRLEVDGAVETQLVRIADTPDERAAGYQWICPEQAQGSAILFIFPRMIPSAFHMRNVHVPLDIYFYDEQGNQVDALVMRPEPPGHPERPSYYQASGSFRYALEIARSAGHDLQSAPAPRRLLVESLK